MEWRGEVKRGQGWTEECSSILQKSPPHTTLGPQCFFCNAEPSSVCVFTGVCVCLFTGVCSIYRRVCVCVLVIPLSPD